MTTTMTHRAFLDRVCELTRQVCEQAESPFENVAVAGDRVVCQPPDVPEACYELSLETDAVVVGLYIRDRWLSESVEADLMHTGDDMEEMLEEELIELGHERRFKIEHYRDEDKRFVFRSRFSPSAEGLEQDAAAELGAKLLVAYHACFVQLGDMDGGGEEE